MNQCPSSDDQETEGNAGERGQQPQGTALLSERPRRAGQRTGSVLHPRIPFATGTPFLPDLPALSSLSTPRSLRAVPGRPPAPCPLPAPRCPHSRLRRSSSPARSAPGGGGGGGGREGGAGCPHPELSPPGNGGHAGAPPGPAGRAAAARGAAGRRPLLPPLAAGSEGAGPERTELPMPPPLRSLRRSAAAAPRPRRLLLFLLRLLLPAAAPLRPPAVPRRRPAGLRRAAAGRPRSSALLPAEGGPLEQVRPAARYPDTAPLPGRPSAGTPNPASHPRALHPFAPMLVYPPPGTHRQVSIPVSHLRALIPKFQSLTTPYPGSPNPAPHPLHPVPRFQSPDTQTQHLPVGTHLHAHMPGTPSLGIPSPGAHPQPLGSNLWVPRAPSQHPLHGHPPDIPCPDTPTSAHNPLAPLLWPALCPPPGSLLSSPLPFSTAPRRSQGSAWRFG